MGGLENRVENARTPFPHPTSARKPADLSADIADTDNKMEGADETVESAGAKMEIGKAKSASAAAKTEHAAVSIASFPVPKAIGPSMLMHDFASTGRGIIRH